MSDFFFNKDDDLQGRRFNRGIIYKQLQLEDIKFTAFLFVCRHGNSLYLFIYSDDAYLFRQLYKHVEI